MTPAGSPPATPARYLCEVAHARVEPVRHSLRRRTHLWLVDLDAPPSPPRLLRPLARFDARDHFDGRAPTIRAGLDAHLASHGVRDADGRALMRLPLPGERLDLTVRLRPGDGSRPFAATVRGRHRPAGARAPLTAALRHPWSTAAVSAGIRPHGTRPYLKGLPARPRPAPPTREGML